MIVRALVFGGMAALAWFGLHDAALVWVIVLVWLTVESDDEKPRGA